MSGAATWYGVVNEDGNYSVLARMVSLDGTGEEVSPGEGPVLKQADVTTITAKVYSLGSDRNNAAGVEVTPAPSLTVSANLFDTLRTAGWPTERDIFGYNFRHDLAGAYAPEPEEWYLVEYKFTLVGGGVAWLKVKVLAAGVRT